MATALFDSGRNAFATKLIDWVNDDIRAILIDTADYTVNLSTHDMLDDIPVAARVAVSSASLAGKSASAGVCDANDLTFSAVTGDVSEAIVLYLHTGVESTSRLIAYIDSATGLPVTPNGGNITVAWDNGANKIFKL